MESTTDTDKVSWEEYLRDYQLKKEEEKKFENEQLSSRNAKKRIQFRIEKILDGIENNLREHNNRIKRKIYFITSGPPGVSKPVPFNPSYTKENVINMFNKLDLLLSSMKQQLENSKNDIIQDLDNEISKTSS